MYDDIQIYNIYSLSVVFLRTENVRSVSPQNYRFQFTVRPGLGSSHQLAIKHVPLQLTITFVVLQLFAAHHVQFLLLMDIASPDIVRWY